ncbi:MAG: hypothetical protein ACK5C4_19450 [Pseudanabaena sp.]
MKKYCFLRQSFCDLGEINCIAVCDKINNISDRTNFTTQTTKAIAYSKIFSRWIIKAILIGLK